LQDLKVEDADNNTMARNNHHDDANPKSSVVETVDVYITCIHGIFFITGG
jgi:hypothetical protein